MTCNGHRHGEMEWAWPAWVARASLVLPLVTVGIALWQRDAFWPPELATVFAAVAVAPWIYEAITLEHLPRWLFVGLVLGGTFGLVADPAEVDAAAFLLVFLVAEVAATSSLRVGLATLAATEALMLGVEIFGPYDDSFPWLIGVAFGWAGGAAVGLQFRLLGESRAAAEASAAKAATEERQRIAREVHDVVAHSLSAVMLHLTGVRRELETGGDARQAADALREAETAGREALSEIRRTVGLLGPGGGGATDPLPGAADVAALVERTRAAGLPIDASITGDAAGVAPTVGLALYRISQEALANAAKHAPGRPVTLRLDLGADDVSLRVANGVDGPSRNGDGRGMGLRGMAERVGVLGGTFSAGPAGGEWAVVVSLPRAPAGEAV